MCARSRQEAAIAEMRIVSALCSPEEVVPLLEAGANAFYCGLSSQAIGPGSPSFAAANRRELPQASFPSLQRLEEAFTLCRQRGADFSVVLNKPFLVNTEVEASLSLIQRLDRLGIPRVMVADLGLLHQLCKRGWHERLHIDLSSVAVVLNRSAVAFYASFGISRIVLPRDLRLREMAALRKSCPGMEFEVMVLNWKCPNIDGFCSTQHDLSTGEGMEGDVMSSQCCLSYTIAPRIEGRRFPRVSLVRRTMNRFANVRGRAESACGACILWDLRRMGIHHVKVLDRLLALPRRVEGVRFIRDCLVAMDKAGSRARYHGIARGLYRERFGRDCQRNCYYADA